MSLLYGAGDPHWFYTLNRQKRIDVMAYAHHIGEIVTPAEKQARARTKPVKLSPQVKGTAEGRAWLAGLVG